jgi:signal transduction histidine kinase
MIRSVAEEIRRIQNELQPSLLSDLGIAATLDWFCREFGRTHEGVRIEKRVIVEQGQIPAALQLTVFRLAQEAFANIARHGKADQVFLGLELEGGALTLTIRDNGQGFDPEEQRRHPQGKGLSGMKGRAELSGGTLVVQAAPGKGTTLAFSWLAPARRAGSSRRI